MADARQRRPSSLAFDRAEPGGTAHCELHGAEEQHSTTGATLADAAHPGSDERGAQQESNDRDCYPPLPDIGKCSVHRCCQPLQMLLQQRILGLIETASAVRY